MKNIVLLGLSSISNLGDRLVYECTKRITEDILQKNEIHDVEIVSYDMLGKEYYSYLSDKKKNDAAIKISYPLEAEYDLKLQEEKEKFIRDYELAAKEREIPLRHSDEVKWRVGRNQSEISVAVAKREIWKCILLSIVTLGIYYIYWKYLLVKNTRTIKNDKAGCTGELLCFAFVPFYSLYWLFTRAKDMKNRFAACGYSAAGNETACLILGLFGLEIVALAIMQNDFNSLPSASVAELHILTDEEKKDLIDRQVEERTAQYKENAKEERKNKLISSSRNGAKKIIGSDTAAVIFFGGGIIKYGHPLQLGYCMEPYIRRADELNIPVMISAVGVDGYESGNDECRVFSEILNLPCVKSITVRDDIELLKESYISSPDVRVRKVPCPTIMCRELLPMGTLKEEKTIGLGVIKPDKMTEIHPDFTEEKQIALWKGIAAEIENRGYRWKFFSNGIPAEYDFAKKILKSMNIPASEDTVLPRPQSLHQLLDSYNIFEGIIASRFHVAVPSFSYGIPFVELVWNVKQTIFAKDMGLEERFIDPEKTSPAEIVDRLFGAMNAPAPEMPVNPQETVNELEFFLSSYCFNSNKEQNDE